MPGDGKFLESMLSTGAFQKEGILFLVPSEAARQLTSFSGYS